MKKYQVLQTSNDNYVVAGTIEATRYDFDLRLRGPLSLEDFKKLKDQLGYYEELKANNPRMALIQFIANQKLKALNQAHSNKS